MSPRLIACLLILCTAAPALADEPPASLPAPRPTRLILNSVLALRYNPLGLEEQLRFGLQLRLFESDSLMTRENFLFLGAAAKISPAFAMVGPSIEVQPLSMFNLRVGAQFVGFFGTFGHLQQFASPAADYSDTALNAGRDAGRAAGATGWRAMIEPMLQAKAGPIAIRDRLTIEYWNLGDSFFYEPTLDTLIASNGWVLANDLDLLYLTNFGLTFGLRWSLVKPLYDVPGGEENGHNRLGVLAAYTFHDRPYARFDKPTLIFMASWYLEHRWRTGADVSRAIPYLVLAFAFQSDLLD